MRKLFILTLLMGTVWAEAQTLPQWRDSVSVLMEQIRLHPKDTDLRLKKAECNINLQQWEYAIQEYGYVIRLDERNLAAYYFRAYCHLQMHHYDLSLVDYETLLTKDPRHFEAHLGRAHVLQKLGRKTDTTDELNHIVQLFPDSAQSYAVRAAFEQEQQQYDLALYDWDQAIRLDQGNKEYVVSRVDNLIRLGRKKQAREALDALVLKGTPRGALKEWYDQCK